MKNTITTVVIVLIGAVLMSVLVWTGTDVTAQKNGLSIQMSVGQNETKLQLPVGSEANVRFSPGTSVKFPPGTAIPPNQADGCTDWDECLTKVSEMTFLLPAGGTITSTAEVSSSNRGKKTPNKIVVNGAGVRVISFDRSTSKNLKQHIDMTVGPNETTVQVPSGTDVSVKISSGTSVKLPPGASVPQNMTEPDEGPWNSQPRVNDMKISFPSGGSITTTAEGSPSGGKKTPNKLVVNGDNVRVVSSRRVN